MTASANRIQTSFATPLGADRDRLRFGLIFATLLVLFSAIFARCAWLALVEGEKGVTRQSGYALAEEWVPARKGRIVDARGFVLARDRSRWVIAVDPWAASGRLLGRGHFDETEGEFALGCEERIRETWSELLLFEGFTPIDPPLVVEDRLLRDQNPDSKRQYRVVGTLDTVEAYERFLAYRREVHKKRTTFPAPREESVREFPLGEIAFQIVGDHSSAGTPLFGIEERYKEVLSGARGIGVRQVDAIGRHQYVVLDPRSGVRPRHGADIELTVEIPAQIVVEQVIEETLEKTGAEMVTAVVLEPQTGAVIAAASAPHCGRGEYANFFRKCDTEEERKALDKEAFRSQLMASLFLMEPGSIMKPIVVGRALQEGVVRWSDPVPVTSKTNWIKHGRAVRKFEDSRLLQEQDRNVRGSLIQSSNGGLAHIGRKLGEARLKQLLIDCGFGELTGFDAPEAKGLRPDQREKPPWNDHTTLSIPIGYEFLATPLQLARAYCAIANGGELVTPHLIRSIGGEVPERKEPTELFRPDIAATLRDALREAVMRGTGRDLEGDEIELAGKTGTAAHYGLEAQFEGWYTSSFAGFAPASDPRYVVVVTVERPDPGRYYASKTAAPAALEILQALLGDPNQNRFAALRRDALAGSPLGSIIRPGLNDEETAPEEEREDD